MYPDEVDREKFAFVPAEAALARRPPPATADLTLGVRALSATLLSILGLKGMSMTDGDRPPNWPLWARLVASAAIVVHFGAVATIVLGAPSGPWFDGEGPGMATPPQFAQLPGPYADEYLRFVKLNNNFHFAENFISKFDTTGTVAWLEVKLRDASGQEVSTLRLPDPNASGSVRFMQQLLVEALNTDVPVEPLPGERIPAPNQAVNTVRYWEESESGPSRLSTIEEHLIPRDRPVFGPSATALILAQSYANHLCQKHGAASAELIRHAKPFIPPDFLFPGWQGGSEFNEMVVTFGVRNASSNN